MKRYWTLLRVYLRTTVLVDLEYRANFLAELGMTVFWTLWILASLTVFFSHRSDLAGWTYDESLIVVGLFMCFGGVIEATLRPNVLRVVELIQKGTMDFVLLKPANSQFMATMTTFAVLRSLDVMAGLVVVVVALYRMQYVPTLSQVLAFGLMLPAGAIILYSGWVGLVTTAFWFVRIDNVTELFSAIFETGRFPISVYKGWLRLLLTFVVPVAFLTTFPAAALIGRVTPAYALVAVALAAVLFYLSSRFWNFAIRFYSSASS